MHDFTGYFVVQHQLRHRRAELRAGSQPAAWLDDERTSARGVAWRAGSAAALRRLADRLEPDRRRTQYEPSR